ncbi:MAG TPA: plastocyanin/azurin family copper-binding protein [Dehalococcoidia bacterium]|nr:plastocyanin/azurin family copper-binding protein [Dehalococcoidia bacterium]
MKVVAAGVFGMAGLVVFLLVVASGDAATQSVSVQDNQYVDGTSGNSTTTIAAGDTVLWTWAGSNPHTVDATSGGESFSSGDPATSGTFTHTFNTPGTYNYICSVHGTAMQGTIIVNAQPAATETSSSQPSNTPVPDATNTSQPEATETTTGATATSTPVSANPAATATVVPAATTNAGAPGSSAVLPAAGAGAARGDAGRPRALIAILAAIGGLFGSGLIAVRLLGRLR